jgi:hypothetical protein
MKIGRQGDGHLRVYLALLAIITIALLSLEMVTHSISQAQTQPLSARDLYYERTGPLPGLKCRVLLFERSNGYRAVQADSVFHTNEHMRLEIESNAVSYLYVLQQGSDSGWDILFPSADIRDNNNRLQPMRPVQVPRDEDFFFDQTPGEERLNIVLTLNPEPDRGRLLDMVRAQRNGAPRQDDVMRSLFKAISEKASVELLSRNLKVSRSGSSDSSPSEQNAIFVVSTSRNDWRVMSELVLHHVR